MGPDARSAQILAERAREDAIRLAEEAHQAATIAAVREHFDVLTGSMRRQASIQDQFRADPTEQRKGAQEFTAINAATCKINILNRRLPNSQVLLSNCQQISSQTALNLRLIRREEESVEREKNFRGLSSPLAHQANRDKCIEMQGHFFTSCTFSQDGRLLAIVSKDNTCIVWDITGEKAPIVFIGHDAPIIFCVFSLTLKFLATISNDGRCVIWDIPRGRCYRILQESFLSCAFSVDEKIVFLFSKKKGWNFFSIVRADAPEAVKASSIPFAANPLVSIIDDEGCKIWNLNSSDCLQHLTDDPAIISCSLSLNNQWLATLNNQNICKIWDYERKRHHLALVHPHFVKQCIFSADGKLLATVSSDNACRIWDPMTGRCLQNLQNLGYQVIYCAFSPDSGSLAIVDPDGSIRICKILDIIK